MLKASHKNEKKQFLSVEWQRLRCKVCSTQMVELKSLLLPYIPYLLSSTAISELEICKWYEEKCQCNIKRASENSRPHHWQVWRGAIPTCYNCFMSRCDKATLKAMQKFIGRWKWPEKDGEIDYYDNQIILLIREENQHILNVVKLFDQY